MMALANSKVMVEGHFYEFVVPVDLKSMLTNLKSSASLIRSFKHVLDYSDGVGAWGLRLGSFVWLALFSFTVCVCLFCTCAQRMSRLEGF